MNQVKNFGSSSYLYDANGNVLDDGVRTYQWDAENRLIQVVHKTGPGTTTFRYDGLGRRISISYNGSETRYLWCGSTLCQGRTSTDTVTRRYYPEGEAIPLSGTLLYYGQDQLGSVRDVVATQNGSRVASFDYDPYGNSSQSNGRVATDFRYAGMFYDQQDGLYLTQYRAYDPRVAKWLGRDPIQENGGINLYGYSTENPINNLDPAGLADLNLTPPNNPAYPANGRWFDPGFFTVSTHGYTQAAAASLGFDSSDYVLGPNNSPLSYQQLANLIVNGLNPDGTPSADPWNGSTPIELGICFAGSGGPNSFAEKLANEIAHQTGRAPTIFATPGYFLTNLPPYGRYVLFPGFVLPVYSQAYGGAPFPWKMVPFIGKLN